MNSALVTCPICRSASNDLFTTKNGFNLFKCRQCFGVFIHPVPNIFDFADKVYDQQYFYKKDFKKDFGYSNYNEDKKPMLKTFERYLKLLERYLGGKKSLLDVGAATGFFIKLAESFGWQAAGVEISAFAAAVAAKDGLKVIHGTIKDYSPASGPLDAVTYLDVFEHLPQPQAELDLVKKILKPGGLLLINTPDSSSLFAKILGKNWYSILPPEHIILYNPKNLAAFLEKNGFTVLLTKKIGKKFSLPYVFQILYNWLGWKTLLNLSKIFSGKFFDSLSLPLNLRDNFFIIAQKNYE